MHWEDDKIPTQQKSRTVAVTEKQVRWGGEMLTMQDFALWTGLVDPAPLHFGFNYQVSIKWHSWYN